MSGAATPTPGSERTEEEARAIARELANVEAEGTLRWALDRYGERVVLATSLGVEDMVLLHLAANVFGETGRRFRVVTLDTGRLHPETYELLDRIAGRYGVEVEVFFPERALVESLVRERGINGFYVSVEARRACCGVRKLEPAERALGDAPAWITGLRREQAESRSNVQRVALDAGRIKLNPLADWSTEEVWAFVRAHDVPYNSLHDRGYPSIGCAPCTRAVEPGQDLRSGRWWWERSDHRECGLHPRRP